ncbi:hypothetical protein [Telluribacter sp. SYSU D00476]|uniref:hypothetical protein n=1 Tax=Telluribacter sp. SYSU D00476 TaxID=2811430 RepID=UPI001FF40527|nr:hypothetical protein [Telluribacter sp. SYSU D00476]
MEEKNQSGIIPDNYTGRIIDTTSKVECRSIEEARAFFDVVKQRLLNVNAWNDYAGAATAKFQVVDKEGNEVTRHVTQGDFFKINIPGPGSISGEGYDWVRVEEVRIVAEGEVESVGIRVRPTSNPQNDDDQIHHFYSEESTSNFTVTREGQLITVGIYDRNTKPNVESEGILEKARDILVGLGAVTGFSKYQWQKLADGLLQP